MNKLINIKDKEFKKKIEIGLNLNKIIFPYLTFLTFSFLFLESYMYIGFLRRYILVNSQVFFVIALISGLFVLLPLKKVDREIEFMFRANRLSMPILVVFYWIMVATEARNYPNYVFSNYHIQPENFLYLVFLSGYILLIEYAISKRKTIYYLKRKISPVLGTDGIFILLCSLGLLTYSTIIGGIKVFHSSSYSNLFIFKHIADDYHDKMRSQWGSFYDLMLFINEKTEEDAVIAIPPQKSPWLTIGNGGLVRYFIYPREYIHITSREYVDGDIYKLPEAKYDYVVIAKGSWLVKDESLYGWPKVAVEAEKFWLFDGSTGSIYERQGDFDPKEEGISESWGLIKVKK